MILRFRTLVSWIGILVMLAGCVQLSTPAPTSAPTLTPTVEPPFIDDFSIYPDPVVAGEPATLSWSVAGVDQVTIDPLGDFPPTGSIAVTLESDTTYILSARNTTSIINSVLSVPVNTAPTEAVAKTPRVALVLAQGGLGDKAFSDSGFKGLQDSESQFGIRIHTYNFQGETQTDALRAIVNAGFDLIILLGAENAPALQIVAAESPDQKFAIIDTTVDAPNVLSVTFRELDGDFLVGALTALLSDTSKVGFLGGADTGVITRIQDGWVQGVKYVNPDAQLIGTYVGGKDDFSGFNKPEEGLKSATALYKAGADVLYVAAGRTGLGAIQAALNEKKLIITTGSDQRYLAPTVVVTSRLKNVDVAVLGLVSDLVAGTFQGGKRELDYKAGGVGLAPVDGGLVPPDVQAKFKVIQQDLESGKITLNYTGQ
jgi:basic membrane protein A